MNELERAARSAMELLTSKRWGTTPYMDMQVYDDAADVAAKLKVALAQPVAHPDTVRLAYLYSGKLTESNSLVDAEMRLLNGESLTLEEARAAIDDAILAVGKE